jgi:hypothetical protein
MAGRSPARDCSPPSAWRGPWRMRSSTATPFCHGRRAHGRLSPTLVHGCCNNGRAQPRHDLLAHAYALLHVGETRQDERIDAQTPIGEAFVGHLLARADNGGAAVDPDRGQAIPEMSADPMLGYPSRLGRVGGGRGELMIVVHACRQLRQHEVGERAAGINADPDVLHKGFFQIPHRGIGFRSVSGPPPPPRSVLTVWPGGQGVLPLGEHTIRVKRCAMTGRFQRRGDSRTAPQSYRHRPEAMV